MKDYCCWHNVSDDFFSSDTWINDMADVFQVGKPMIDFINAVVDDYE
jgi:hypothetical protein